DEYVKRYTNACTIVSEDFLDTEELDGLFSGFDAESGDYDPSSWQYAGMDAAGAGGQRDSDAAFADTHGSRGGQLASGEPPAVDHTLQHPRCVFQLLRKHYQRYTPELVERVCGVPRESFLEVARLLCDNSGPERTSAFCYAVGWT